MRVQNLHLSALRILQRQYDCAFAESGKSIARTQSSEMSAPQPYRVNLGPSFTGFCVDTLFWLKITNRMVR